MTACRIAMAAVRFGDGDDIDALLESVVRALRARGHTVAGYLQREAPDAAGCCPVMHLEDIASGDRVRISQALGRGSRGCRLDPGALAEVSARLLRETGPGTELIVLNRFGKGEADGQGFRTVIEHACTLEIPVLTAVRQTYEPAWTEFVGGLGCLLDADPETVTGWALGSVGAPRRARDAA